MGMYDFICDFEITKHNSYFKELLVYAVMRLCFLERVIGCILIVTGGLKKFPDLWGTCWVGKSASSSVNVLVIALY